MVSKNEVYTYLTESIKTDGVYFTQYYEVIPKALPCVYFRTSHSPIRSNLTLKNTDEQLRMYCYIEVYGQNIDGLVEDIEAVFRQIHFVEELCEMIPNYDPEIERVSMRFMRVITGGNTLTGE